MKSSIKSGLYFGLTSGVITTLGLMVGLYSGSNSIQVVIGGILTIAIADSFSDALGVHIAKESEEGVSQKDVWLATFSTLTMKMSMAISFIIPVLLLELPIAIIISVAWGLIILSLLSYFIAKSQGDNPLIVIFEHLTIAILVIVITFYVGEWVARVFV